MCCYRGMVLMFSLYVMINRLQRLAFSDYEKRFVFHDESEFPDPEKFLNVKKEYPSQALKSKYNIISWNLPSYINLMLTHR